MNEEIKYSLIMLCAVLVSSVSQIGLKISSNKNYESRLKEYLNPWVITSYALFFSATLITIFAMRIISVSRAMILESAGYIFVTVLSCAFLKERCSIKKTAGIFLILLGVIVYSISFS